MLTIDIWSPTVGAAAKQPNGVVAYVSGGAIFVVSEDGEPAKLTSRSGPSLAWSPDGGALAFIDSDLTIVDARTGNPTRSVRGPDDSPSFDADGNLWFRIDGDLYRMRIGGTPTRVDTACGDGEGEVSPDGRWFAYADASSICVCTIDGRQVDQSVVDAVGAGTPRWSPDAKHLAFGTPSGAITVAEVGGSAKEIGAGYAPDWSIDGTRIVFTDGSTGGALMVMDRNGGSRTRFVSASGSSPSWGRGQVSAPAKRAKQHAQPNPASEMKPVAAEVPMGEAKADVDLEPATSKKQKKPKKTTDPQDAEVAFGAPIMPPVIVDEPDRRPLMAAVAAAAGMITAGSAMLLWYFRRSGFR